MTVQHHGGCECDAGRTYVAVCMRRENILDLAFVIASQHCSATPVTARGGRATEQVS